MGAGLTIEETNREQDIMYVLSHPAIWDAISFDGCLVEDAKLEFGDDHIYLITKSDGRFIGINYFKYLNPKMVEFHPSVLPLYRSIHAYDSVKMGIDWMFTTTDIEKITVQIPECFGRVLRFAKRMGFIEEGRLSKAYPKMNKMIDINLLGLTRLEWADL